VLVSIISLWANTVAAPVRHQLGCTAGLGLVLVLNSRGFRSNRLAPDEF
jgi:hypothetical protein